jgi:hypothetical protein
LQEHQIIMTSIVNSKARECKRDLDGYKIEVQTWHI